MAIFTPGPLITNIRGRVGGLVFSANGSAPYIKQLRIPVQPRSRDQSYSWARLAKSRSTWQALTTGDKDDWNDWAALAAQEQTNSLGEAYYLSGYQWCIKLNNRIQYAEDTILTTPPTTTPVPDPPTIDYLSWESHDPYPILEVGYPEDEFDGFHMVVYAAYDPGGARTAPPPRRPLIALIDTPGSEDEDIGTQAYNAFGLPLGYSSIWCFIHRQTTNGQRSAPTIIAAWYVLE